MKPERIQYLAGLGAALRPGCANVLDKDGISTTQHYYRRKNGEEPVTPYHPAVDPILEPTYNLMLFQEQAMRIAEAVAGFTKQQADNLRSAAGKKKADQMAQVKTMFIKGAKEKGIVSEAQAEEIFRWIKESQKYSFNLSHSVGYSIIGYQCGFLKQHIPSEAFCSWLRDAHNKQKPFEEVAELVNDAKHFGFTTFPPDFFDLKINFQTDGSTTLTAGLSNIKGIGEVQVKKLIDLIKEREKETKPIRDMSWYEFLVLCASKISKTVMEGCIQVGAFRKLGELRSKLLAEYNILNELRDTEIEWIRDVYTNWSTLADAIEGLAKYKKEKGLATKEKRRIEREKKETRLEKERETLSEEKLAKLLKSIEDLKKEPEDLARSVVLYDLANILHHPIVPYRDNPAEIAMNEERLLGIALTCSIADGKPGERWTMTCKDILDNPATNAIIILKVKIDDVRPNIIKTGKNKGREMAWLKLSDGTASIEDIGCFADQWEGAKDEEGEYVTQGFKNVLAVGRVLEIQLERGFTKKGQKPNNSLHVKDVWVI